ncbi:MAG: PAS domain S-box protein [Nitrospiraceae bacterium]|nr:PAS domain S-box protein [Nitrospiraceae bacterium]
MTSLLKLLRRREVRYPLKIALIYAVTGGLWIFLTDIAVYDFTRNIRLLAQIETAKGWFFIAATSIVIFCAVRKEMRSLAAKDEEIKKNERFLSDIFESIQDGMIIVDRALNIVRANPLVEKWLGYERLIGKKCNEVFGVDRDACIARKTIETGRQQSRTAFFESGGEKRWLDIYSYPLLDSKTGELKGAIGYLRDITVQKKAEDALRESEEKYRALFDAAVDAMVITDSGGIIMEANRRAGELSGVSADELAGRHITTLHPPEESARYMRVLSAAVESERPVSGDIYVLRSDGVKIPIELSISASEAGGKRILFASMRDISSRRKSEERIKQQLDMLSVLYAGAQNLSESLDLSALAENVVLACVANFGAGFAWIGYAEHGGRLRPLALYPDIPEYKRLITARWDSSPSGEGQTGRAIRSGTPVIIEDLRKDDGFAPWLETALSQNLHTGASFPLVSRKRTFGALTLYSEAPGFFTRERVRFFQAYAHQAAAALENARLYEETEHRLRRLDALFAIDTAITSSLDLQVTLNVLLDQAVSQLQMDAADVLLMDSHSLTFRHVTGRGFRTRGMERVKIRMGESNAGRAVLQRRVISLQDVSGSNDGRAEYFEQEGFVSYFAAPLIAKGQVKGVLELFSRSRLSPDPEWRGFLETVAYQAAIAIENVTLFDDLQRTNTELALAYETTLEGWSRALDLRDRETVGHAARVTEMAVELARAMGVGEQGLLHLRRGALLHDIGKMAIPDNILLKPGPLNEQESEIMRRHPVYALDLLQPIPYLRPALPIPYLHHERWDGSGYPQGLKGEQIPLPARIFAVADVWDALCSERPYRPAWPRQEVAEYLRRQSGKHFDPSVVEAFLGLMDRKEMKKEHEQ